MRSSLAVLGVQIEIEHEEGCISTPYIFKELEEDVYALRALRLRKNPIVFDIGANIGIFSVVVAKLFPDAFITAVEPVRQNISLLRQNIEINQVSSRVKIIEKAVTSDRRPLELWTDQGRRGSSTAFPEKRTSERIDVQSLTLDDLFFNVSTVDLLKLDIEGGEYEVVVALKSWSKVLNFRGELHKFLDAQDPYALDLFIKQKVKNSVTTIFELDT